MNIRKGAICDLTSIINIEKAVYNKPYWNVEMLKKLFIDSIIERVWVIENRRKIIGFLIEPVSYTHLTLPTKRIV